MSDCEQVLREDLMDAREDLSAAKTTVRELTEQRDEARLIAFSLILSYRPEEVLASIKADAQRWLDGEIAKDVEKLLARVKGLPRVDVYVDERGVSPYCDEEIDDTGRYVRWSDLSEAIGSFRLVENASSGTAKGTAKTQETTTDVS